MGQHETVAKLIPTSKADLFCRILPFFFGQLYWSCPQNPGKNSLKKSPFYLSKAVLQCSQHETAAFCDRRTQLNELAGEGESFFRVPKTCSNCLCPGSIDDYLTFAKNPYILAVMKDRKWPILVEPSLLSGDFGHLANEARRIADAGADAIHIDIMDGHFVPNLTLGPKAVASINRATDLFLDVHIMIYHPFDYIERFVESGADRITFHFEATEEVEDTLTFIRRCNIEAGLAFRPETSASFIPQFAHLCDLILIMTVNPGFGGQAFMHEMLEKVRFTREMLDKRKIRKGGEIAGAGGDSLPPQDIQVDGGINEETAKLCIEAGANVLVAGTYLFETEDMASRIRQLKGINS